MTVGGEFVVDLWGGHADAELSRRWERDTLVNVYSTTKGMTALCAHILIERGEINLDEPVATYWPEFAAAGKERIPFRWLLSHRAGLMGPRRKLTPNDVFDWDLVCRALAESEPWFEPGSVSAYHALSFGYLVGEVIRRVTGTSVGAFLAKEVTGPLDADLFIGCPDTEQHRCADMIGDGIDLGDGPMGALLAAAHPALISLANLPAPQDINTPEWRGAEIPAGNGQMTARGLATVYGALANGGSFGGAKVVEPASVDRMREPQEETQDLLMSLLNPAIDFRWKLGFMPNVGSGGPNSAAFGHGGAGGSYAMADPENNLSYAYVMNKMAGGTDGLDTRSVSLVEATYESLGM